MCPYHRARCLVVKWWHFQRSSPLWKHKCFWRVPDDSFDKYLQARAGSTRFYHSGSTQRRLVESISLLSMLHHLCPAPPQTFGASDHHVVQLTDLAACTGGHYASLGLPPGATGQQGSTLWSACSPSPPHK